MTPDGEPKLLDFGLARVLQPELSDAGTDRTATALRFLTPDYASPEQVRGERIATSSDIYSLGVVLYELLAGRRPYRTTGSGSAEIARAVCEQEPPRPSASVPALRGDCDNIVMKALRKEPERRYASVEQLSDDIGRHLDGKPVHARKDTFGYRTGKFVSRHKTAVAATAAVAALLVAATGAAIRQTRIARAERAAAEANFNDVRQLADTFLFEFHDAIKDLPGSTPARRLVVRRALEYLEKLSRMRTDDAGLQRELADAYQKVAGVQGGHVRVAPRRHGGSARQPGAGDRDSPAPARAGRRVRVRLRRRPHRARGGGAAALPGPLRHRRRRGRARGGAPGVGHPGRRLEGEARGLDAQGARGPLQAIRRQRARHGRTARRGPRRAASRARRLRRPRRRRLRATAAFRRELALTHQQIVYSLAGTTERAEAESSYAEACRLLERLEAEKPEISPLRRELAYVHVSMGTFCEWSGDVAGALAYYSRALPILETLVREDPQNADARLLLAETCNSVGYAMVVAGASGDPLDQLRRSERLFDGLIADDPANTRAVIGRARLYESFGSACDALAAKATGERTAALRRDASRWYARSQAAYVSLRERGGLDARGEKELEDVATKVSR